MTAKQLAVLLMLAVGSAIAADENAWFYPLGMPPKAAPRRISGGESLAPLPLPATPLRRSERKRQPSPQTLFGKVLWGETAAFTYPGGIAYTISDWNLCPADLQQLLAKANRQAGLAYGSEPIDLSSFSGDPEKTPVLFFSGTRSLKLSRRQLDLLRTYVLDGGMLVFDSVAGSPYFHDSAKQMLALAFPDYPLRSLPLDHPFYHMLSDIAKVKVTNGSLSDSTFLDQALAQDIPLMEAIYVGCRIAVLVSPSGLGCGWDDHEVPFLKEAVYYDVDSANRLGLNLVAYAVGYAEVGREECKPELFCALDERDPTDEFVFAQIKHEGSWNVHPGGASALLQRLQHIASLRVSLKRAPIQLGQDDLAPYTFLYLSGLDDFHFDAASAAALRAFLNGSGTLFINNGLGLKGFDRAVRRELKQVLPEARLERIPLDHPLYRGVFTIDRVRYTPALIGEAGAAPLLEGITLNGDLRVIYSPYDIEAGWQGCEHPLIRGLEPESAMQMGINVVMYAMTH
jgi:hypothetical protein